MPNVLILGATSDIALALARRFAQAGTDLVLAAREPEHLAATQADLQIRYGVRVERYAFDATDFESHPRFLEQLQPFPELTICVFGYLGSQPEAQQNWQEALRIIQVNYTGAVSVLNRVAERYEAQGSGGIIGIGSVAGDRGRMSNYLYGSAKAGFAAYLAGLRNRLYHAGVHVLTVKPGFVQTRMTEGLPLPKLLTAQPEAVARDVFRAWKARKNVCYTLWFWRWIMLVIRLLPEPLFKRLKL